MNDAFTSIIQSYMDDEERVALHKKKTSESKKTRFAKGIAKRDAKKRVKTKFKIGRNYFLRIKPKDGSANVVIKYQCVKTIYTVNDIIMNIVIMKQITPFEAKKYTLDKHECEKFHIKFQPGLEVWPMDMNWIPERKDQTPYYLYYK